MLFIADTTALIAADHPILVVATAKDGQPLSRCIPSWLWSADNNLNLANMD